MEIEFRDAVPGDVDAIIPLIYSSGPAAFDYIFSHNTSVNALEFLRRTFVNPEGEFGYENHIVGTFEGDVVASGVGFSCDVVPGFTKVALKSIFKHYGLIKGAGVIRRGLQAEHLFPPPKVEVHYIGHIGVTEDLRGHGIGHQLMTHLIEQGRELGRPRAILDVSCENPRAQALYERLGFQVTEEYTSYYRNETAIVQHHQRMELPLISTKGSDSGND
jgi:ribosomal protein S18 acetylase RimI-like enzyme